MNPKSRKGGDTTIPRQKIKKTNRENIKNEKEEITINTARNRVHKADPWVFYPPLIFFAAFCLWIFKDAEKAGAGLQKAYHFITYNMAWLYEWYVVFLVALCLYFMFGPYANKRLGDEKPEFSTLSWLGMIFTSFAGLGVLTWTSIEFFYYLQNPPFGAEPFSPEAEPWALAYPLFHWGFSAWSMNTIFGLVFAYLFFVKKKDLVRPSSACEPIFGERLVKGWLGKLIDALFVIGFVGGATTCIGVNVPTVIALVEQVFGIEHTLALDSAIILSWSFFMAILLYTGLKKGVRFLSDFRVYFGFGILAVILFFGPTTYILNTFTDSLGHLLQNFVRMSLYTDPNYGSGVPQDWTIFYWAWYLALVLQAGIFLGRISRGRTVREYIIGALAAATAGSWVFFAVFSNFSMYVYKQGTVPIAEIMATGGQGAAIVAIWTQMPFSSIMIPVLLLYAYIAMQTLLNGSTYTLAMVTTTELSGDEEPPIWIRIFWSLTLGAIAIALVYIGGIRPSQTTTIIGSIPIFIISVLVLWAFIKDMRKEWGTQTQPTYSHEKNTSPALGASLVKVQGEN